MDGCTLAALIPSADQVKTGLSVLGSIVMGASLVTSLTPTPTPGTRLARVYRAIEIAAFMFGRAKERGELPATGEADTSLEAAIALVKQTRTTQPPATQPLESHSAAR